MEKLSHEEIESLVEMLRLISFSLTIISPPWHYSALCWCHAVEAWLHLSAPVRKRMSKHRASLISFCIFNLQKNNTKCTVLCRVAHEEHTASDVTLS